MTDTTETAELEIVCPGMLAGVLDVLSIGKGDLRLVVGGDAPEEIEKARRIIEQMLKAGYAIFVETDAGPKRVKKFNAHRMTYLVSEIPEETEPEPAAKPRGRPKKKAVETDVPVAGSKATAVGRTAGG